MSSLNSSYEKDGFIRLKIPESIVQPLRADVAEIISKRLNLDIPEGKLSAIVAGKEMRSKTDSEWKAIFGHLSNRLIASEISSLLENWIRNEFESMGIKNFIGFHFIRPIDLQINPELKPTQKSVYFRVVRPQKKSDVGGPHRDSDFWKHGVDQLPEIAEDTYRMKIWAQVYGCTPSNSLHVIPGSHLEDVPIWYETQDGVSKPRISHLYLENAMSRVASPCEHEGANALAFDDNLVHWGPLNDGDKSAVPRISIEGTMLFKGNPWR